MRHGRAKAARKTLQYFSRTIGLKPPYFILMDGTFVAAMFQYNISPFKERVDRVLQTTGAAGANKYCITQVAVDELQSVCQDLEAKKHAKATAFQNSLRWIQTECIVLNHKEEGGEKAQDDDSSDKKISKNTPAQEELLHHIQNNEEKPYIVATQDESLLRNLRSMGKVPIVRLANNSVLLLEQPSKQSQMQFQGSEKRKWRHNLPESEQALVKLVKEEKKIANRNSRVHSPPQQRGTSKAKGPNPLSCKRKERTDANKESVSKKRRNRAKKQKIES